MCFQTADQVPFSLGRSLKMTKLQAPNFPPGANSINDRIGFIREENTITYIHNHMPIFRHDVDDLNAFRLITSQLYVNGCAKQVDICQAFGVSSISVKRSVKIYREKGMAGFFETPRRRGAGVLTPPVLVKVQELLDNGYEIPEVARELNIFVDTLRKAVKAGKLHKPFKKNSQSPPGR